MYKNICSSTEDKWLNPVKKISSYSRTEMALSIKNNIYLGHKSAVYGLAYDGFNHYFSADGDGNLVRWKAGEYDLGIAIAKNPVAILCLLYNKDKIYFGDLEGNFYILEQAKDSPLRKFLAHPKGVFDIKAIDGSIFTCGANGSVTKWDESSGFPVWSLKLSKKNLRQIEHIPDSESIAVASSDGNIYIVSIKGDMRVTRTIKGHRSSVFSLAYNPGAKLLYTGGMDAYLKAWNPDGLLVWEFAAHYYTLNDLFYDAHTDTVVSAGRDHRIRLWTGGKGEHIQTLETTYTYIGHSRSVNRLFNINGINKFLSTGDDAKIIEWNIL